MENLTPIAYEASGETFKMGVVDHPLDGINQALVIAGSDRRGKAYGLFELSRRMGVSPWKWWSDVHPKPAKELYVSRKSMIVGPPSIKYRGIFLNDEDWGLQSWVAQNVDTDIKDIGLKTYAHIFELLLRLKANFIWPAMHPSTKAFWYYKENPEVATKQMLSNAQKNQNESSISKLISDKIPTDYISISANNFIKKQDSEEDSITFIPGSGIAGGRLTVMPFTAPSVSVHDISNAPYIEYNAKIDSGSHAVYVKFLPTHYINKKRELLYAVSVNGNKPQVVNLQAKSRTKE